MSAALHSRVERQPPGITSGGGPEFESPYPTAASPSALAHDSVVTRGLPHSPTSWGRCSQVRASTFSPAVPPACHKQRSPAVSSGQSRSLEAGRWAGRRLPDLGGGRRPKLHGMQGLMALIGLAVPGPPIGPWSPRTRAPQASATRRDRNPRCSRDCSRDAPRHPGMNGYRMGRRSGVRPA